LTRWLSPEGFTPAESVEDQGDSLNRQRLESIARGLEAGSMLVRKLAQSLEWPQDARRSLLDVLKYGGLHGRPVSGHQHVSTNQPSILVSQDSTILPVGKIGDKNRN